MLISIATNFLQGLGIICLTRLAHEAALQLFERERDRTILVCVIFATGVVATMSLPFFLSDSLRLDMRNAFLILAPFFGGLPAALTTAVVAVAYCLFLGGPAVVVGVVATVMAALIGLAVSRAKPFLTGLWSGAALLGAAACLPLLATLLSSSSDLQGQLSRIIIPYGAVNFVGVAVATIVLRRSAAAAKRQIALSHQVETDPLTDLYNEQAFQRLAPKLIERAAAHGQPSALLMIQVEGLKSVREHLGRLARDSVLQKVGHTIAGVVPKGHLIARVGNLEFAVLLLGRNEEQATIMAENIRSAIAAETFQARAGVARIAVSVGVAALQTGEGTFKAALDQVDGALQRAKRKGHNNVEVAHAA